MTIQVRTRLSVAMVGLFIIVWTVAFAQTFEEVEDPETGQTMYQQGGNPKNCFDKNGKPKKCPPQDINVPLDDSAGIAVLFTGACIGFYYLKHAREKALEAKKSE